MMRSKFDTKNIFSGALYVLVGFLILGGVFYGYSLMPKSGAALSARAEKTSVRPGESFAVKVQFSNGSTSGFKNVSISVTLPSSTVAIGAENQRVVSRKIGDVASGAMQSESFDVMAIPSDEGTKRIFLVTASYTPETVLTAFQKTAEVSVDVIDAGISLAIAAPDKVFSGEVFETKISYGSTDATWGATAMPAAADNNIFKNMRIVFVAPEKFTVTKTTPEQAGKTAQWPFDANAEHKDITVAGSVELPDNATCSVKAQVLATFFGREYVIASQEKQIAIAPSPLSLSISLPNGKTAYYPGETLAYVIAIANNSDVPIENISLIAKLKGEMLDFGTVSVGQFSKNAPPVVSGFEPNQAAKGTGAWNATIKTAAWNAITTEAFQSLKPGESGTIPISITIRKGYPIEQMNDKNFTASIEAKIESPTVPKFIDANKTVNTANLQTKIGGAIVIESVGLFRDAASGILNQGPFPPKAGTPTNFTIHWKLANYATDMKTIVVRAELEDGVTLVPGSIKSNIASIPVFDEDAGVVTWTIDRMLATTGVISAKSEAMFQIAATPRQEYAGQYMKLLTGAIVQAVDEFTGEPVQNVADPVTTELPYDITVTKQQGLVTQ